MYVTLAIRTELSCWRQVWIEYKLRTILQMKSLEYLAEVEIKETREMIGRRRKAIIYFKYTINMLYVSCSEF